MVIANVPESAILAPLASKPRVTAGMSSHKPNTPKISKRGASAKKSEPTSHSPQTTVPSTNAA